MYRWVSRAAIAFALLAAVGCTGGSDPEPEDTAPDGTAEESPTPEDEPDDPEPDPDADNENGDTEDDGQEPDEPEDPFAIPDEITPEYAEEVIDELWRLHAATVLEARDQVEPGEVLSDEILDQLRAINAEERFSLQVGSLQQTADDGFEDVREDYGQPRFEVENITEATDTCLVLSGIFDITETARPDFDEDPRRNDTHVVLVRADNARDPDGFNPTPWSMAMQLENPDPDPDFYEEFC